MDRAGDTSLSSAVYWFRPLDFFWFRDAVFLCVLLAITLLAGGVSGVGTDAAGGSTVAGVSATFMLAAIRATASGTSSEGSESASV